MANGSSCSNHVMAVFVERARVFEPKTVHLKRRVRLSLFIFRAFGFKP